MKLWRGGMLRCTLQDIAIFFFPLASELSSSKGPPAFWCMAGGGKFNVWLDSEKCFVRMMYT